MDRRAAGLLIQTRFHYYIIRERSAGMDGIIPQFFNHYAKTARNYKEGLYF